jgi:hypothetical protein
MLLPLTVRYTLSLYGDLGELRLAFTCMIRYVACLEVLYSWPGPRSRLASFEVSS